MLAASLVLKRAKHDIIQTLYAEQCHVDGICEVILGRYGLAFARRETLLSTKGSALHNFS